MSASTRTSPKHRRRGQSIGLRCANLLDTQYFEPGIGAANSGDTPGAVRNGVWVGARAS
jgi:hypothetical protein